MGISEPWKSLGTELPEPGDEAAPLGADLGPEGGEAPAPMGQQQLSVCHVPVTLPGCRCACTLPCCPAVGFGLSGDEDGDSAFLEVTQTLSSHLGWVQHT